MTQRMIEIDSPFFIREEQIPDSGQWQALFGNQNPLALEIGCGTGHFIASLAKKNPHINYIAADIYNKGCYKTSNRIAEEGLSNVRVVRLEARYLLTRYLSKESLSAVYINCPDPWPKKRHRRRRLVNRAFLQMLLHYLTPNGDLFFSSDFRDYSEDVAQALSTLQHYRNCLDKHVTIDLPGYPLSKYMRRFLGRGLPIYFLHWRRDPALTLGSVPFPDIHSGFRVAWQQVENG